MAQRRRLTTELVRRRLATDLDHARRLIASHKVRVNGAFADNAGRMVDPGDSVELVADPPPFVSRGGIKLEAALNRFCVDPAGLRCLDVGASTGGFTDCLLQRGAAGVVALDVGHGQLHESLVGHPKVVNMERTNLRHVAARDAGGPFEMLTGDLSFISLGTVMVSMVAMGERGAPIILLVKPQFEARRAEVSRGAGVITDPAIWERALVEVAGSAEAAGAGTRGAMVSPIRGGHGNVEFLIHLVVGADSDPPDFAALAGGVDKTL